MKLCNLIVAALIIFVGVNYAGAQTPKIEYVGKIIDQPDSPVKIISYKCSYGMHSKVALVGEKTQGIRHQTEYQNTSERGILAVGLDYVMFNLFDEFLEWAPTIETDFLKPSEKDKSDGVVDAALYTPGQLSSFLTGIVFVSRVRFADGEIWRANLDTVIANLTKIDKEFPASALKHKTLSHDQQK